jgi:Zn-dependent peptidase ImmA (M78 family)
MRRGFKPEAGDIAREVREELGLSALDPLDPWALAAHLDIPVWSLGSYASLAPSAVRYLSETEQGAFSAMMACHGLQRVIIYNDSHAKTRQRADIAHELAHALLLHRPHPALDGRPPHYDEAQEEEAKWLGGVLQVTDEYCLACCRKGLSVAEAAFGMGVSEQLMRWRLNMSGAKRRVARARARGVSL